METKETSVYGLAIWSRILFVFMIAGFACMFYQLVFGGAQLNYLLLDIFGIEIPLVTMCLNGFFVIMSVLIVFGGLFMLFTKNELTISEEAIRYVSGKQERELKWDELSQVKLIAQDSGAMKNRTLEFYEKTEPEKSSYAINISFLSKRDEIIAKVEQILKARGIRRNF
jgi:hypothetical protein